MLVALNMSECYQVLHDPLGSLTFPRSSRLTGLFGLRRCSSLWSSLESSMYHASMVIFAGAPGDPQDVQAMMGA